MAKKTRVSRKKTGLKPVPKKTQEQITIETAIDEPIYEIASLFPTNFKSYKLELKKDLDVTMPDLAPITVVVGPNSAGKSSFIQFLVMMSQSISENVNYGLEILNSRGPFVDLGFYKAFINNHDVKKHLHPVTVIKKIENSKISYFQYNMDYVNINDRAKLKSITCFDFDEITYQNREIENIYEDAPKRAISFLYQELSPDSISNCLIDGNIPTDLIDGAYDLVSKGRKRYKEAGLDDFNSITKKDIEFYLKHIAILVDQKTGLPSRVFRGRFKTKSEEDRERLNGLLSNFGGIENTFIDSYVDKYIKRVVTPIGKIFQKFNYVGPSRNPPKRSERNIGRFETVGTSGENTSNILLYNRKSINNINSVFKTLDVPYEINIAKYGKKEIDEMFSLTLTNLNSKEKFQVSSVDVGFGIFQFLPIILTGIINQKSVIPVEQPEIHLHPKLIANLGDFFIETSNLKIPNSKRIFDLDKKYFDSESRYIFGNQWIIETHSELLIRRLLRRVREGKIKNEDISILYVNPPNNKNDKTVMQRLKIDKKGNFIDRWPDGFFSEALDEM